ncbi:zinc ribbon domain-containing protein [Paenibacillus sp. ACRRX]|uniref:zinc ribbon domain-containing protein n=1 Tax=unclassified Paenibacillus TaxID=185978 RepID=UPI001EF68C71|nr:MULTISPECIES: zinc ribbon domain-containing protein [unclassified Paenibacillus]MCG7408628.1 zinc ribbon domain-containing protein [Paenibacillus sp. ACRRX]MDK8182873.1 zinc ribbon domain-containing protein [Paenibacillus sp. UMB4589-SE434]
MNRFLQKMKEGASKASEKAQNVVELNRIQSQIESLRKEWEQNTYEIGCLAYEAYKTNELSGLEHQLAALARVNARVEQDIEQLEWKRCELRHEKRCDCGEIAPWTANYCAKCGTKLPDPPSMGEETAAAYEPQGKVTELRPFEYKDGQYAHPEHDDAEDAFHSVVDEEKYPRYAVPQQTDAFEDEDAYAFDEEQFLLPRSQHRQHTVTDSLHKSAVPNAYDGHIGTKRFEAGPEPLPEAKPCTACGSFAPLEAKWCERCGSPFV